MDSITKTPVHKRTPLHFLVGDLQVWVSYLDVNENGPFGVKLQWMEDEYACSPLEHITEDGGYSYHEVENFIMVNGEGIEKRMGALETDPGRLTRLQPIWVAYQQKLRETVFSV
jgi:hypothetical protein